MLLKAADRPGVFISDLQIVYKPFLNLSSRTHNAIGIRAVMCVEAFSHRGAL